MQQMFDIEGNGLNIGDRVAYPTSGGTIGLAVDVIRGFGAKQVIIGKPTWCGKPLLRYPRDIVKVETQKGKNDKHSSRSDSSPGAPGGQREDQS